MKRKSETKDKFITFHPSFEKLKIEVEKLHEDLSKLFLERDHLIFVVCVNIEADYMTSIGMLEYKAYELECNILRLKRKVDLIQQRKNRQEKIALKEIEETLDKEFAFYQSQLEEQLKKINKALQLSKCEKLSDEESKELRKLYFAVVKALHPDLHPSLSQEQKALFHNAVAAYELGDLENMRVIATLVEGNHIVDMESMDYAQLIYKKDRLTKIMENLKENMEQIKSQFPYNMKSLLGNPEELQKKKEELEEYISQLKNHLQQYEDKIEEMLR